MLARVKQDYAAGPVMAFSGREYVRGEWRQVPAGFEDQAKNHPLLDTQPSLEEVRAQGLMARGLAEPPVETPAEEPAAVSAETAETPAEEPPSTPEPEEEPKTPRRRKRAAEE